MIPRAYGQILRWLVLAAALAALAGMARHSEARWPDWNDLDWTFLILLAPAQILCNLMLAQSLRVNLGAAGLTLKDAHAVTLIRAYSNLIFPFAGTGYSAYLLKEKFQIPLTRFGVASVEWTAHQYLASAVTGLAMLGFASVSPGFRILLGSVLGITLLACLVWMAAVRWMPLGYMRKYLNQTDVRAHFRPVDTLLSVGLQFGLTGMRALRFGLACLALGNWPGVNTALVLSVTGDLGSLINLTPNGIGLREALVTVAGSAVGLMAEFVLVAVMLDRIAVTAVTIGFGAFYAARIRFQRTARG